MKVGRIDMGSMVALTLACIFKVVILTIMQNLRLLDMMSCKFNAREY